jgi:hypothetical protein
VLNPTEAIEYDDLDLGLLDTTKRRPRPFKTTEANEKPCSIIR